MNENERSDVKSSGKSLNGKTVAIVLLVVACLGLAAKYVSHFRKSQEDKRQFQATILQLSNQWQQTSAKLEEQTKVNTLLETNLSARTSELGQFSNQWVNTAATLAKTEAEAKVAAETAKEEIAKRDGKIKELENQNDDMTKAMEGLKGSITTLEAQIATTEKKLASAEGDRAFLLKELKRLQAEKAELERQFNDLAVLRTQVRKLRDELSIARRLDWIRRGLYGDLKGGQRLQQGMAAAAAKTNYDLNVEIKRDGGATILPRTTNAPPATNAPAATNTPPPTNPPAPAPAPPASK